MTSTIYLTEPVREDQPQLKCKEVRVLGNVVWATQATNDREWVIPLANIAGVEGDEVEQYVDEIPSPGGQFTELVTDVR